MEDSLVPEFHRVFKRVAAQAASECRVNFGTFLRQWGLEDFLVDQVDKSDLPQEIAARALADLCTGDLGTRDQVVCLTVTEFLDETVGRPSQDPEGMQRLRDLAEALKERPTYEAFRRWASSWYP